MRAEDAEEVIGEVAVASSPDVRGVAVVDLLALPAETGREGALAVAEEALDALEDLGERGVVELQHLALEAGALERGAEGLDQEVVVGGGPLDPEQESEGPSRAGDLRERRGEALPQEFREGGLFGAGQAGERRRAAAADHEHERVFAEGSP